MKPLLAIIVIGVFWATAARADTVVIAVAGMLRLQPSDVRPLFGRTSTGWDASIGDTAIFPVDQNHQIPYHLTVTLDDAAPLQRKLNGSGMTIYEWELGPKSVEVISFGDYSITIAHLSATISQFKEATTTALILTGEGKLPNRDAVLVSILMFCKISSNSVSLSNYRNIVFSPEKQSYVVVKKKFHIPMLSSFAEA